MYILQKILKQSSQPAAEQKLHSSKQSGGKKDQRAALIWLVEICTNIQP